MPLELDVRDEGSIRRMVRDAAKAFGRIDILVNNAGCNVRKPAVDVTWDDWNLILDTNLRGAFFVRSRRREMIRTAGPYINIGSVTSVMGYAGLGPTAPTAAASANDDDLRTIGPARHHGELPGAGWFRPSRTR